ncbi:TlpA family protein disulfide reductase [Bizionia sp.]|uniref:TlpA family protein disulfide reductase n=1 Tax=Bizionia sp. TaxID=1954480 RepID=UPI003A92FC55
MLKNILFLLFLISGSSCIFSQNNISTKQQAPPITITDWIANVPNDKNLNHKYIVLEFWATWCAPCLKNVPHLNDLQNIFRENKELYFVSITNEEVVKVKKLLERVHFESIVVSDIKSQTQIVYGDGKRGITRLPLTILIGKDGYIKWIGTASQLNEFVLEDFLNDRLFTEQKTIYKDDKQIFNSLYKKKSESSLSMLMYLAKNDSIDYYLDIQESPKYNYQIKSAPRISKLSLLSAVTLKDIMLSLGYKHNQIIIKPKDTLKTYDVLYKNSNFNPEALSKLEQEILSYTGFKKNSDFGVISIKEITIENTKLLPKTKVETTSTLKLGKNKSIFYKYTIEKLVGALNKNTNYYYHFNSKNTNYYDFEIDFSSERTITESLLKCGFSIKDSKTKTKVYTFQKN